MSKMAKTMTLIGIMSGIVLLFYFGGLVTNTASSVLLDLLLAPERFQASSLIVKAVAVVGTLIGISTLLFRNNNGVGLDQYLMVPFIELFLSFGWDFLTIYQNISSVGPVAKVFAVMLFGPLMLMYVISVIEWWRGVET
jgi:hypothetical protein